MASLYDAIETKGTLRYRKDKKIIAAADVPENVRELITANNVVDENGLVIVDQKTEEAKGLSEDEQKELDQNENQSDQTPETTEENEEQKETTDDSEQDGTRTEQPAPEEDAAPQQSDAPAPEVSTEEDAAITNPAARPVIKEDVPAPKQPAPKFVSKVPQSSPGMGFPRKNGKTVDIFDLSTPHTKTKLVGGHVVPLSEKSFKTRTDAEIEKRLKELGKEIVNLNNMEIAQSEDTGVDIEPGDGLQEDVA